MRGKVTIGLIALLLLAVSCNGRPDNVLSDGEMSDLLADLHIAEAYMDRNRSDFRIDSAKKVLRQSILADNGVTEGELQASLDWYGHNMDRYTKLYEDVENKIRKRMGKSEKENIDSDAEDLWPLSRMITVSPNDFGNGFSFSLPVSGLQPGTSLEWRMVPTDLKGEAKLFLGVDYDDFSADYATQTISGKAPVKLSLTVDSVLSPKRIYGYFHLSSRPSRTIWVDSIRLVSRTKSDKPSHGSDFSGLRQRRFRLPEKKKTFVDTISPSSLVSGETLSR